MRITFVKKIKADGSPCRKCIEVEERLERAGLMSKIDVVVADERDLESEGMRLAAEVGVDVAPFFVVTRAGGRAIYTSYVKLLKEVLSVEATEAEEAIDLLKSSNDVDFI